MSTRNDLEPFYDKRYKIDLIRHQLYLERTSFESHWQDLADNILPRRIRLEITDVNRGERRHNNIVDSTATLAARTLRAGMMSGVTSPARPWYRLAVGDPALNEVEPVKQWLHTVTQRMTNIHLKSNLYNVLPTVYGDLGVFSIGCMMYEEDIDSVIRFMTFPIGSYWVAKDNIGRINVFYREFRMTVRQLLEKFGERNDKGKVINWENFSTYVKNEYDMGHYETYVDVGHLIAPNEDFRAGTLNAKNKKFQSTYFELGQGENGSSHTQLNYSQAPERNKYLRESGYDLFPVLVPRWEVTGEDVYGTDCPGMTALGDIRGLQLLQKRGMQAIEKFVNPPMKGPTSLRNHKVSTLPGSITFVDNSSQLEPLYAPNSFRVNELIAKENEHQKRISRAFYEDLFLMLATSDRRQITAREIDERHEEKLLAIGPVLEQLNQDLLDPLIDGTFDIMLKRGLIPKPPDELQGRDLKVEYISEPAQALSFKLTFYA